MLATLFARSLVDEIRLFAVTRTGSRAGRYYLHSLTPGCMLPPLRGSRRDVLLIRDFLYGYLVCVDVAVMDQFPAFCNHHQEGNFRSRCALSTGFVALFVKNHKLPLILPIRATEKNQSGSPCTATHLPGKSNGGESWRHFSLN